MLARTVPCMPSTRRCSHTSMLPRASTGRSKGTRSPCELCMASMRPRSAASKVTPASESKRPDWKCGTTLGGSLPSERISSSVGSDTK